MAKIKKSDRNAVFSRLFGDNIQKAREHVAALMIALHVGPNALTFLGVLTTLLSGWLLALGAGDRVGSGEGKSWYGAAAAYGLILASAFDILDGAVARNKQQITKLGAFLDSCCDRFSDAVIFVGISCYYLRHQEIPFANYYAAAGIAALAHAEIISYIKARAENFIDRCPVGYWQRGERIAAILIGLFSGHIATVVVMLAILPGFTVLRRLIFAGRQIHRKENNLPPLDPTVPLKGIMRLAWWRYRRGTLRYDIVTALNISMILFIDLHSLLKNINTS